MNFLEQSIGHEPGRVIPPKSLDAGGREELSSTAPGFMHAQSVYICREAQWNFDTHTMVAMKVFWPFYLRTLPKYTVSYPWITSFLLFVGRVAQSV